MVVPPRMYWRPCKQASVLQITTSVHWNSELKHRDPILEITCALVMPLTFCAWGQKGYKELRRLPFAVRMLAPMYGGCLHHSCFDATSQATDREHLAGLQGYPACSATTTAHPGGMPSKGEFWVMIVEQECQVMSLLRSNVKIQKPRSYIWFGTPIKCWHCITVLFKYSLL